MVFDVETTGLSAINNEVIQIAAFRLVNENNDIKVDCFERYIKNTVSIGDSESINHISEEDLAKKGLSANVVFNEFIEFSKDAVWVGHNVDFDIRMVRSHAKRLGIDIPQPMSADTCDISRRFIKEAKNYKLGTLAKVFGIYIENAHDAKDDAKATIKLLGRLIPLVQQGVAERRQLVRAYGPLFYSLASDMERWKNTLPSVRPPELVRQIINESGLETDYQGEPRQLDNLRKLELFFYDHDQINLDDNSKTLDPDTALKELLELSACSKNVDMVSTTDDLVPIITVHQSKGLEFDTVFIAGAVDGEFPDYRSEHGKALEEEKRAFYVAMTRAKKRLYISSYKECNRGYTKRPSSFIDHIPAKYKFSMRPSIEAENNLISPELVEYYEYEDDLEAAYNQSSNVSEDICEYYEKARADITDIEEDKVSIQDSKVGQPESKLQSKPKSKPQENDRQGMLIRGGLMMAGSFLLMGPAGPAALATLGLGAWNEHMKREIDERHRDDDF